MTTTTRTKPLRIGAGAGYAGDRIDPAQALAERGALDVLVFECLAERTIALAQLRRRADPAQGFDPLLAARLRAVLPACAARGVRIVTNMGAAHPVAGAAAAHAVALELGLPRLRVAAVTGDDVLAWARAHGDAPLLDPVDDGPRRVGDLGDRLVSANAYLGADALLPALHGGADIVVAGRVADPALFLAPLMHAFGWRADDWPRLGQGIVVGHLLECAAQVSGGYLADPGYVDVPRLHDVGFPLAEVQADGSAVIAKLDGSGGRIDRLSCTAQLLYEVEDPARYLQPDVAADFTGVRLREVGPDRVRVDGGSGRERPALLKASLGYLDGWIGEGQIGYAGPGAAARARLALQILVERLRVRGLDGPERRAELIGVDSLHGPARAAAPGARRGSGGPSDSRNGPGAGRDRSGGSGDGDRDDASCAAPREVRARLAVRCRTRAEADAVGHEVEALYLNGPAAGGGVTVSAREVVAVASVLVPRDAARPAVQWFGA